jgi:hypothetical protein
MEKRKNMNRMRKLLPALLLTLTATLFAQDLSGTYTGTMKAQTPDGTKEERGAIVLKQDGEKLVVTGGPSIGEQYAATKVARSGDSLKFEIAPRDDSGKVLQFEVTVHSGKLTGRVKSSNGSETSVAALEFTRQ